MDENLKAYLDDMKRELREHAEGVETRLLSEFWKWARVERIGVVEDRVADVERGKNVA